MQPNALSLALSDGRAGLWTLVDPALCPESLTHYSTQNERHPLPLLGLAERGDDARSVVPYLSRVVADSDDRQQDLASQCEWALRSHGVSWLESDRPGRELASVLGRRMNVLLSERQPALIRFADTRVLPVLHSAMSDEQRRAFFAPVSRWWYFDRRESLKVIEATGSAAPHDSWTTPWEVEREQELALLSAAEADTVLALLNEMAEDDLRQMSRADRHDFIRGQIERARTWCIEAPTMQAAFCMAAMSHGEAFSDQPAWKAALDKVRAGGWSLLEAIEAIGRPAAA